MENGPIEFSVSKEFNLKIRERQFTEEQLLRRARPHVNRFPNLHDAPSYENLEAVKKSNIILIRHANSVSNNLSEKLTERLGKDVTLGHWLDT